MKYLKKITREISLGFPKDKKITLGVLAVLAIAFFIRVENITKNLGFYFDQGRDALVVWDFWHKGKLFLIGPTTGIEGIFRGPFYYWLIAPFYLLGGGNPIYPIIFLITSSVLAIGMIFYLGYLTGGKITGFLAAIVATFSFSIYQASRWLSNPTPMLIISMLIVYSLFLIQKKKQWAWVMLAFLLGMSMQFGSAAEIFYIPAVLFLSVIYRKYRPTKKILLLSLGTLLLTFLPQIYFDLKHEHVLSQAISKFIFDEKSFKISFWEVVKIRAPFYYETFSGKIFHSERNNNLYFLSIGVIALILNFKKLIKSPRFITVLTLFISPIIGMLFFQGNKGNVYDYYFTGFYLIFILLFSVVLASISNHWWGKLVLIVFVYLFIKDNLSPIKLYMTLDPNKSVNAIYFGNQTQALEWVYKDIGTNCQKFNQDAYVPPVIPHAYNYLFTWYGTEKNCLPVDEQVNLLYTLYEVDPPHPERLEAWLARQEKIGIVENSATFGGITVQKRKRI